MHPIANSTDPRLMGGVALLTWLANWIMGATFESDTSLCFTVGILGGQLISAAAWWAWGPGSWLLRGIASAVFWAGSGLCCWCGVMGLQRIAKCPLLEILVALVITVVPLQLIRAGTQFAFSNRSSEQTFQFALSRMFAATAMVVAIVVYFQSLRQSTLFPEVMGGFFAIAGFGFSLVATLCSPLIAVGVMRDKPHWAPLLAALLTNFVLFALLSPMVVGVLLLESIELKIILVVANTYFAAAAFLWRAIGLRAAASVAT